MLETDVAWKPSIKLLSRNIHSGQINKDIDSSPAQDVWFQLRPKKWVVCCVNPVKPIIFCTKIINLAPVNNIKGSCTLRRSDFRGYSPVYETKFS